MTGTCHEGAFETAPASDSGSKYPRSPKPGAASKSLNVKAVAGKKCYRIFMIHVEQAKGMIRGEMFSMLLHP